MEKIHIDRGINYRMFTIPQFSCPLNSENGNLERKPENRHSEILPGEVSSYDFLKITKEHRIQLIGFT